MNRSRTSAWLVFLVAVTSHLPALRNSYALDGHLIAERRDAFAHAPVSTLFDHRYFELFIQDTYRPVVTASTMIDHRVGVDPRIAGHVQTMLLHGATTAMLASFASELVSPEAALVAALVYAVHPAATEATICLGFREDVLVAFFLLAALRLALSGRRGHRWFALAAYVLALFTKENAIVFPALLLVARLTIAKRSPPDGRALARELGAFALATAGYLAIRFGAMASPLPFADPIAGSTSASLVAAPRVFLHDVRLFVAPWPLLVLYSNMFPLGATWTSQLPWIALGLAVVAAAVWMARVRPVIGFGMLWYLIALAPTLHLAPMRVVAADRFVHVSLVGGALAVGGLYEAVVAAFPRRAVRLSARAVAGAVILVFLALTELRIPAWHDDLTIWTDTLRHNPRAYIGHAVLAQHYDTLGRWDDARHEVEAALADCPRLNEFGRTRFCARYAAMLGFAWIHANDARAARPAFDEALSFAPDFVPAIVGHGYVALADGDVETARARVAQAEGLAPIMPAVRDMVVRLRADIDRAAQR